MYLKGGNLFFKQKIHKGRAKRRRERESFFVWSSEGKSFKVLYFKAIDAGGFVSIKLSQKSSFGQKENQFTTNRLKRGVCILLNKEGNCAKT